MAVKGYRTPENIQRLTEAAQAIVDIAEYRNDSPKAQRLLRALWKARMQAATGCTFKTAQKYVDTLLEGANL